MFSTSVIPLLQCSQTLAPDHRNWLNGRDSNRLSLGPFTSSTTELFDSLGLIWTLHHNTSSTIHRCVSRAELVDYSTKYLLLLVLVYNSGILTLILFFWGGANRTYGRCIPLLIKWRPVARLQPTDPPNLSHNWILNKHQTIILDKNVSFTSFSVRPVCPKNSVPPLNIVGCDGSLFKVCSRVEPGEDTGQEDGQNNDICF